MENLTGGTPPVRYLPCVVPCKLYFGLRYITYWIATPIFMLLSMKYLKLKSWKVNIVITVLYTLICYVVFVIILHLPIYKVGILGQLFRYI